MFPSNLDSESFRIAIFSGIFTNALLKQLITIGIVEGGTAKIFHQKIVAAQLFLRTTPPAALVLTANEKKNYAVQ